jgi:hypothetical protein
MPPQQRQRVLDLLGDSLHFRAHVSSCPATKKGATYIAAPVMISSWFQ